MNKIATIGDNNPPDPIDDAITPFGDYIAEAEAWLDGAIVENEGQMKAVDELTRNIKAALKSVGDAEKSVTAPMYDEWKAEKARWKPTLDDLARIRDGLVSAVADFKAKLAAEKKAKERAAWEAADQARREAEAKAAQASVTDISAQREVAAMRQAALDAVAVAQNQAKDTVKGMRKVTRFEVLDMRALVNWIAANDKDAMADFATEYARKNHKSTTMAGVRVWEEKEAF